MKGSRRGGQEGSLGTGIAAACGRATLDLEDCYLLGVLGKRLGCFLRACRASNGVVWYGVEIQLQIPSKGSWCVGNFVGLL